MCPFTGSRAIFQYQQNKGGIYTSQEEISRFDSFMRSARFFLVRAGVKRPRWTGRIPTGGRRRHPWVAVLLVLLALLLLLLRGMVGVVVRLVGRGRNPQLLRPQERRKARHQS